MSRDRALGPIPADLGPAGEIDSFGIEPGVILLKRFVALDTVARSASGWAVPVTDLERELGAPPHHRLRLELLRADETQERKLRRAIRIHTAVQPRVHAWLQGRDGLLLITDPVAAPTLTAPLTEPESATVALSLTAALGQLHAEGVTGVSFSPEAIHLRGREVAVEGYHHILANGTAEEDVHRLANLLEFLSGNALARVVRPTPGSALELWERVRSIEPHAKASGLHLPATAPFVGRQDQLARLMEAARRARNGEGGLVLLRGDSGMGRTRILQRFAVEVDRWMDALVLTGRFHKDSQAGVVAGFAEALDGLAGRRGTRDPQTVVATANRIRQATAPLTGMVSSLTPALQEWLGASSAPPDLHLDERFGQRAATLANAIRAIGTADRPLVLLLDDAHFAEPGSRAVLEEFTSRRHTHHALVVVTCDGSLAESCVERADAVLDLAPLTRSELADLMSRAVPGALEAPVRDAERLAQASQGKPVAAWAVLRAWAEAGILSQDATSGAWGVQLDVVETTHVVDLYARQWQALHPHQQWIVLMAALRSGRVSERWLVEVTGWNATEVGNAVESAVDAGLLAVEPDGGLRFPNNAVRRVVEESVAEDVLANAHRQIADWLDNEERASAAQRAWHRELSRPVGRDEQLAELHAKGGRELLAIYDLARAKWHFERAMARTTAPSVWVVALESRADIALLEGRSDAALDDYLEAMTYGGDPSRGLEIAGNALYGFYRQSASKAAHILASNALRLVGEPLPRSRIGTSWAILRACVSLPRRSQYSTRIRDALCKLYTMLVATMIAERPALALLALLRGQRHARGLDSGNAAAMMAMGAALLGGLRAFGRAERLLTDAEAVARRSESAWGVGVVEHIRAQNQLAVGAYDVANKTLQRAIDAFRTSGDMTVAVFSYVFQAVYAANSRPLSSTLDALQEAAVIARRQGNAVGLLVVRALRTYVLARRGEDVLEEALALSREITTREAFSIDMINAHAYAALSLQVLGQRDLALEHGRLATQQLGSGMGAVDYQMDAYVALAAALTAAPCRDHAERRALKRCLKRLDKAGRASPRLRAAGQLYSALAAIHDGDQRSARTQLERLVDEYDQHSQLWFKAEAHRLLADLLASTSRERAEAQRSEARSALQKLGIEDAAPTPVPPARAVTPLETVEARTSVVTRAPEPASVLVDPLVKRLLPAFERALPRNVSLVVDVDHDAKVRCNPESLQLLVVNLVLAARDALGRSGEIRLLVRPVTLEQEESARLPGVNAEAHLLVQVRAIGYSGAETITGLGVCCEITASIGGFVDVSQQGDDVLVIAAYLAAASTPSITVAAATPADVVVIHGDSRVRQTVVSALRDMGLQAEGIDPRLNLEMRVAAGRMVFAEARWAKEMAQSLDRVAVIAARGDPPPSAPHVLRVPFTLGELDGLIRALEATSEAE